jgi:Fe-S-cluster containining protein
MDLAPTLRPLSKTYASRRGPPAVSAVDPRIFTMRYFAKCMECTFCNDVCCFRGCDAALEEVTRIVDEHGERLALRVHHPRDTWFEPELKEDPDFKGGVYRSTRVEGRGCVFLNTQGRGCGIHAYAMESGLDYHDIKPWLCWLFPLTVEKTVLSPQVPVVDRSLICSGQGISLYRAQRDELFHLFEPELIAECDALEAEVLGQAANG